MPHFNYYVPQGVTHDVKLDPLATFLVYLLIDLSPPYPTHLLPTPQGHRVPSVLCPQNPHCPTGMQQEPHTGGTQLT